MSLLNNPKVSIIIPCYNVENFIRDCLNSVRKQSLKDIEIICVNDGSTDSTVKILEEYLKEDSRIVLINQENMGLSGARNSGFNASKSNYVTFLDSDDWLDSNYIEKLYEAITKNNCDIAVSGMVRKRPKAQKYRLFFDNEKIYSKLQDKIDVCKIPMCCYVCGKLFKKELIKNSPFKERVYFEDVVWTPEILKKSDKIVTVPKTYYYYRVNNSSIVKSVQSIKKQHDSYVAKSYIVKFFKENNLKLNKKNKYVTKYITYFLNIPILKVKECDSIETTLLFGFLPIFKKKSTCYYKFKKSKKLFLYKVMDSHIYINFFGIHMGFKQKQNFNYDKNIVPIDFREKRKPELIISLTSFPVRIKYVHKAITTLINQSIKADRIVLWLADSQFINKEKDLPQSLLRLKEFGLEIKWCEDIGSYKKLVPALREFPNDIIVTADDDMYYQYDWLESLYNKYIQNKENIYTRRACRIEKSGNYFTIAPHYDNNHFKADYSNQLMGGAGTLYPPNSLYKDVIDTDIIENLIPTYDDIYFWAMAVMAGTKIGLAEAKDLNFYNIENTQEEALCKINGSRSKMNDSEAFNRIFEKYPEIIRRLNEK